ncbi:RNA polymerase III-inhibiting protein maf1 [Vermiconidia calcicola]|uniref:RNA polymerase III-inhibiting protein maf1 n=1 Tax=Vermiconidia calcicola TaxID=1690605 RepID=A0ACC3NSU9_9PEZI|nr:RNA polymerase III-inhibiting protein maf1 [Vermiconidia calcicola]
MEAAETFRDERSRAGSMTLLRELADLERGDRRAVSRRRFGDMISAASSPTLRRVQKLTSSQYLPLREFDLVTNALNFSTLDCHVIGGCDVYTTKAAGGDKKLYKDIENSLESQYESLVRLSASLSPPRRTSSDDGNRSDRSRRGRSAGIPDVNLSRASPFGSLSKLSARRTYAYLIATLNASNPDYDFSHTLRPSDFRKKFNLQHLKNDVDSTLQNLRPRHHGYLSNGYLAPPSSMQRGSNASAPVVNSGGGEIWSPKMWSLINKEMELSKCQMYTYTPDDDPFDGEEGALWSNHYFFFHKDKKRVCYLYFRALSIISHSPVYAPAYLQRPQLRKASGISFGEGASKRASYWLGSNAFQGSTIDAEGYGDDDDDEMIIEEPNDDEVEVPYMDLDEIRSDLADGYYSYDNDYDDAYLDDGWRANNRGGFGGVRGVSEDVGNCMEI